MNAVSEVAMGIAYEESVKEHSDSSRKIADLESLKAMLEKRYAILPSPRMHPNDVAGICANESVTYAVHARLRSFFYRTKGGLPNNTLPSLIPAGVASGELGVDPGRKEARGRIVPLYYALIEKAEHALENKDRKIACDLCRDAFSILRARMEAHTAPRWCDYSAYSELGIRLASLVKGIGGDRQWDHRDPLDRDKLEHWHGALYLGELAWLYNDVGLALFGEGLMADAYAVWEQAFDISRLIEEDEIRGGTYQIQILVNLSYSFLELGRLASAREYLTQAERMNRSLDDESLHVSIVGLSGLIHHLNGNHREARNLYADALEHLNSGGNLRARSFLHKHSADLHIASQEYKEAGEEIRTATILADEGHYPDLIIEAQMSEGRLAAAEGDWPKARLLDEAAVRGARRIKSRRIESAALCNLARLAQSQNDSGGACTYATLSLKLANEFRLGLRVSHSLVVLGLATIDSGHRALGAAYLRQAKQLAERQQYWLRARDAESMSLDSDATGPSGRPSYAGKVESQDA